MPDTTSEDSAAALSWCDGLTARDLPATILVESPEGESLTVTGAFPWGWSERPADVVGTSWLRQMAVVPMLEGIVRLQACLDEPGFGGVAGDQCVDGSTGHWPLAGPVLLIGAVRGPSVVYQDEAEAMRDELVQHLEPYGVSAVPSTSVDRGHAWTEPSVIAFEGTLGGEPVPDWQVRALGITRQMGVTTVVRVDAGQWQVLALTDEPQPRFAVVQTAACSITRDDEHRCPMQQAPAAGQYCRMRGGPWTSASIHASAAWKHHRDRLVAAVGCDTCEGVRYQLQGQVFTGGGPISLVDTPIPTRWQAPDERRLTVGASDDSA